MKLWRSVLLSSAMTLCGCGGNGATPVDQGMRSPSLDFASQQQAVDGGIGCGIATCSADDQTLCCIDATSRYCAPAEACSAGIVAACDGPEDCAGQSCCGGPAADSPILCSAQCTASTVCHSDGDCPPSAPHCCATLPGPSGYLACAPTC